MYRIMSEQEHATWPTAPTAVYKLMAPPCSTRIPELYIIIFDGRGTRIVEEEARRTSPLRMTFVLYWDGCQVSAASHMLILADLVQGVGRTLRKKSIVLCGRLAVIPPPNIFKQRHSTSVAYFVRLPLF